jgi:hypothetical protein
LDKIQAKDFRIFLLAIHSHIYTRVINGVSTKRREGTDRALSYKYTNRETFHLWG